jgi:hypothetical protein
MPKPTYAQVAGSRAFIYPKFRPLKRLQFEFRQAGYFLPMACGGARPGDLPVDRATNASLSLVCWGNFQKSVVSWLTDRT